MDQKPTKFKLLLLTLLIVGVGGLTLLINACKKSQSSTDAFTNGNILTEMPGYMTLNNLPKGFEVIGQLHNEAMDTVFNAVKTEMLKNYNQTGGLKTNGVGKSVPIDFDGIIMKAVDKFGRNNKVLQTAYAKLQTNFLPKMGAKFSVNTGKAGKTLQAFNAEPLTINHVQQGLMDKIDNALTSKFKTNSLLVLKAQFEDINKEAAATLSVEDANAIYAATSTGFASYQYWFKNYRKWYFAINAPLLMKKFNDDQLNHLYLKSSTGLKTNSWGSDTTYHGGELNEVTITGESSGDSGFMDAIGGWWEEHGKDIVKADVEGAVEGGLTGAAAAWSASEASLVFGPEGVVVSVGGAAVGGAVVGGAINSAKGTAWGTFWDNVWPD